jgi:hypothetical protein
VITVAPKISSEIWKTIGKRVNGSSRHVSAFDMVVESQDERTTVHIHFIKGAQSSVVLFDTHMHTFGIA